MNNSIFRFLCSVGGANLQILRWCPNEAGKFANIGGALMVTGTLATLTGFVAFSKVTDGLMESRLPAVFFALFWGLLIFTMDRYLVISMEKEMGGTSLKEYVKASFRIGLAILIAVVIAIPLKLAIFNQEIQSELPRFISRQYSELKESAESAHTELVAEISRLNVELEELGELRSGARTRGEEWKIKMDQELVGEIENPAGAGPQYGRYKQNYEQAMQTYDGYDARYTRVARELNEKNAELGRRAGGVREDGAVGLLAELRVLYYLVENNKEVKQAYLVIIALLIVLETLPLLTKLMSRRSVYDDLVDLHNEKARQDYERRTGIRLADLRPKPAVDSFSWEEGGEASSRDQIEPAVSSDAETLGPSTGSSGLDEAPVPTIAPVSSRPDRDGVDDESDRTVVETRPERETKKTRPSTEAENGVIREKAEAGELRPKPQETVMEKTGTVIEKTGAENGAALGKASSRRRYKAVKHQDGKASLARRRYLQFQERRENGTA